MTYISDDDIENWCYSPITCENATVRRGVNEKTYVFCKKYARVAWSVLILCKADKAGELKAKREAEKQKNLGDFTKEVNP